jgi:hypothetical protein
MTFVAVINAFGVVGTVVILTVVPPKVGDLCLQKQQQQQQSARVRAV